MKIKSITHYVYVNKDLCINEKKNVTLAKTFHFIKE